MLEGQRVLVTGATGQVARPIAEQLRGANEVWAAARFRDEAGRAELEAAGIGTAVFTLGDADLEHLPDVDVVIHCAADAFPRTADAGIATNAEGTGFLMQRYADVQAFFHMSSASVYRGGGAPDAVLSEDDELGGYSPFAPHYAMSKLAAEAVVRFQSRSLGLPAVMARLNVAYGTHGHGGLPNVLHELMVQGVPYQYVEGRRSHCTPIFEDDIVVQVQGLLEHAEVGAPAVILGGDEQTTIEEIIDEIERLTGLTALRQPAEAPSWETQLLDATRRREWAGPCAVPWREGVRRVLVAKGAISGT